MPWSIQTTCARFYGLRTRDAMQTDSGCCRRLMAASTRSLFQDVLRIGGTVCYNALDAFYVHERVPFDEGNETRPVSAPVPSQTTHTAGIPRKTAPASLEIELWIPCPRFAQERALCFHRYHRTPDRPFVMSEASCDRTLRVDDATRYVDLI
ncbi:hypothetical protein AURDEDRAFT_176114 [Auricularia subglabra TFB-10046 SS5]|uniref:Uncharacterized protein n=1 Tax=Auricularia subglabra (strain TFB-10046 / SS5) TaxID=717982 RepID=J0CWA1_AURST|nr:hypothetical protein AURDEDRAFT_176114 [Auricularia subglabra TFB-10046 SS5]